MGLTVACFLRGGVDRLPTPVALGEVGARHPHVVPHVVVPNWVVALGVCRVIVQHLHVGRVVPVYGKGRVGVVGRYKVGHHSARDAQSTTHCSSSEASTVFRLSLGENWQCPEEDFWSVENWLEETQYYDEIKTNGIVRAFKMDGRNEKCVQNFCLTHEEKGLVSIRKC